MTPQTEIRLVLPYPISANRYWRSFVPRGGSRAVTVVSDEAKAYKRDVAKIAAIHGAEPLRGRVHVEIKLYPARPLDWAKRASRDPMNWDDTIRCIDLDNARKVLYDALKGVVFEDDDRVFSDYAARMEPDGEARVVVLIRRIVRASPKAMMFEQEAA